MSYICPVCNNSSPLPRYHHHLIGRYSVHIYDTGSVNVWNNKTTDPSPMRILTLNSPKTLSEDYIDKMLLLK